MEPGPITDPAGHVGTAGHIGILDCLTVRQAQVARLVAGGATNNEIACLLCLSRRTVRHHLSAINRRLGTRSQAQVVTLLWLRGWVDAEDLAAEFELRLRRSVLADSCLSEDGAA